MLIRVVACRSSRGNSSVVLVTGKGSPGTGSPSRSQIGSQPSPGVHSSRRLAGTSLRTLSLWRTKAAIIAGGSSKWSLKRSWSNLRTASIHGATLGRHVVEGQEDRVRSAPIPRLGITDRQEHERSGNAADNSRQNAATWPINDGAVASQHGRPINGPPLDRIDP